MKLIEGILKTFGYIKKRSGTTNPAQWLIDWVSGGAATSSGVKVSESSALKYTPFWSAVRIISGTVAELPFLVYRRLGNDDRQRAPEHPVYTLLHDRPNDYMDALTFIESRQAHVLTYGNGYAEIQRNGAGKPIALWPLLPDRTFRKISENGMPYYEVRPQTGETVYLPDYNVLHIKGLGFDGYTGYNVVAYHKEAIGYGIAVKEYGGKFFSNNASPSGVLEHPEHLSTEAAARLSKAWENNYGGLEHSHRIAVLEEGMKWEKIGVDPEQAQALEIQKYTVDDCARIFNIPPHKLASMEHSTFCLPADVEVYAEDGNKSIANIGVGDRVWSLNAENRWVLNSVLHSECTGTDKILHIRTTNRALRANAKHKVLIRRKYDVPRAGKGGYQWNEWRNEYVPTGELQVGDVLVASEQLPDMGLLKIGERQLTNEFMAFCGLLLGDGNICRDYVAIARANNAEYMDYYRKVIQRLFVSYDGGNGRNGNIGVQTRPVRLQESDRNTRFSSVLAVAELRNLGLSGTAHTKQVPGWVFQTDYNKRLSFLCGFLDADGSVDKKGRISYSSCNETMLSQIRHLCMSCGVAVTNMRCQEGVTTLPNGKMQAYKQYEFTCSNPGDNQLIGSNDPKYIERLTGGKPFDKKGRKYPWYGGRGFDIEGCSLSRIISIEEEPAEPVYDLEVAGSHSFIANGVVVHNSNIEEQNIDFVTSTMLYWFRKWELECNYKLFMPSERSSMFCELLVDGLLRGNMQAQALFFRTGRQWGYLSTNDIRKILNMNSIGPEGDIYLEPLNMKPAGSETPANIDNNSRQAHRDLLVSQWLRVIHKQLNTGQKGEDFYKWQRGHATTILFEPVNAYASLHRIKANRVRDILSAIIEQHINRDTKLKLIDAERLADMTMQEIGGNHAAT